MCVTWLYNVIIIMTKVKIERELCVHSVIVGEHELCPKPE